MFVSIAPPEVPSSAQFRPIPAIYQRAPIAEGRPLPLFGSVGTGGIETAEFVANRQGYRLYLVIKDDLTDPAPDYAPYAELMKEIQAGFGRTMSHLPAVFGVSRQTLYNWLSGEIPKEPHREKLVQLAEAARVFAKTGTKPTAAMLERTLAQGRSFAELIGEGSSGREIAQKLIRIVQRGADARNKLDAILGERKVASLDVSDMGRRSFSDEA